jgi:hypothetical protein
VNNKMKGISHRFCPLSLSLPSFYLVASHQASYSFCSFLSAFHCNYFHPLASSLPIYFKMRASAVILSGLISLSSAQSTVTLLLPMFESDSPIQASIVASVRMSF